MTVKRTNAKVIEWRFAYLFLKKMGIDPTANVYLAQAVIAWLRAEHRDARYPYNNPLGLRPGRDIAKYSYGRFGSGAGFAKFRTIEDAAAATAARFLHGTGDPKGWATIVKVIRRGSDGTDKGKQKQAIDFMLALAKSKWSGTHYGDEHGTVYDKSGQVIINRLVSLWLTIGGLPALPAEKSKTKPVKPHRGVPRDLDTRLLPANYIDARAIQAYSDDRHPDRVDLPGGLY